MKKYLATLFILVTFSQQAAAYLDLKPQTLCVWRGNRNDGPKFVKLGRLVKYRVSDLDDFLSRYTMRCTADCHQSALWLSRFLQPGM